MHNYGHSDEEIANKKAKEEQKCTLIHNRMARESQSGGGSQELLASVAALGQTVQGLSALLEEKLDIAKVTQSTVVTEAGYAADARQLNAELPGTLAYSIAEAKKEAGRVKIHREAANLSYVDGRASYTTNLQAAGLTYVAGVFANLVATENTCSVSVTGADLSNYRVTVECKDAAGSTRQTWIVYIGG